MLLSLTVSEKKLFWRYNLHGMHIIMRFECFRKLPHNPLDKTPVVGLCSYGERENVRVFTALPGNLPISLPIVKAVGL